jgi:hypothetical protein
MNNNYESNKDNPYRQDWIDPNPTEVPTIKVNSKYGTSPETNLTTIESIMNEYNITNDFTNDEENISKTILELIKEVVRLRNIKTKKEVLTYNNNRETHQEYQ